MSMMLAVSTSPFLIKAAVIVGGEIQELAIIDPTDHGITDRYLWGRVVRIERQLDAAFLDCGLDQPVFLAAKDARALKGAPKQTPIGQLVEEGQYLLVQGLRDPDADKGGRVTADLKLFGSYMTLRPLHDGLELSRKIPPAKRDAVLERSRALLHDAGFIVRETFLNADDASIEREAKSLQSGWQRLQEIRQTAANPCLLPTLDKPSARIARMFDIGRIDQLIIDDPASKSAVSNLFAKAPVRVADMGKAFEEAGIDERFQALLAPVVELPSGGRLVMQSTLAATMIDVDSGGGKTLTANLEAAREIAKQIRLRNLGGTIIVDFLDLSRTQDRKSLDMALKNACKRDRLPVQIYPMSPLGIVQISRARRGRPLSDWYLTSCTACQGSGHVESRLAQAEALWRAVQGRRRPLKRTILAQGLDDMIKKTCPDLKARLMTETIEIVPSLKGGYRLVEH